MSSHSQANGPAIREGRGQPSGGGQAASKERKARWRLYAGWAATVLVLVMGPGSGRLRAQHDAEMPEEMAPMTRPPARPTPAVVTPPAADISFTTRLGHTAIWVGDQFHYMILVDHAPKYEFVLDNLSKETINMDPFQVVALQKQTTTLKNGNKRVLLDITLSSFATGQTSQQIPQLTLFYFQRDGGTARAEEAAAESLTIPGPAIGLRTTLPPAATDIRDAVTVSGWPRWRWSVAGAGFLALVVLVAGVGWETIAFVRTRKSRRGPDRRKAMEAVRARWASTVPSSFSDPANVAEFYNQSYQTVKEYLGYYLETPTLGLTAEELQQEMQRLGSGADLAQKVANVLGTLETARYASNGISPDQEAAQRTAQQIREIFAVGSRR